MAAKAVSKDFYQQANDWLEPLITQAQAEKMAIPPAERLAHCDRMLQSLANASSTMELTQLAIWLIQAITEAGKAGIPNLKALNSYLDTCEKILPVLQKTIDEQQFVRLHAAFRVARSKLKDKQGDSWGATWDLEIARQIETEHDRGHEPFRQIGEARKLLRLGFASVAATRLEKVRGKLEGDHFINASLLLAKVYRLMRREDEAESERANLRGVAALRNEHLKELEWETSCSEMTRTGRCHSILAKASSGKEFFNADYYSEAVLWARAFGDEIWLKRLPAITQVRKIASVGMKHSGLMKEVLSTLHDCDRIQISMFKKLELIGEVVAKRSQIDSIDKELLTIISCVRWLVRSGSLRLAAMCLADYQAKSVQLTDHKSNDALGIAADLMKQTWFKDFLISV